MSIMRRKSGEFTKKTCICEKEPQGAVLVKCKAKDCSSPWWHVTCAGVKGLTKESLKPLTYTCPLCVVSKGYVKEKLVNKKASGSRSGTEKASGSEEIKIEKKVDEANQVSIVDDKMETGEKLLLDFKNYFNEKFEKLHNEVVLLKQKNASEKFSFTGKSEEKVKKAEEKGAVAEKPKPRRRPVALIVEEKNEEEKYTDKTWSEVVKVRVSKKLSSVPVRNNKVSVSGKGVLTFDNVDSRDKAQELLSTDYKVSLPEKVLPKIQILHLDGFMKDDKSNLKDRILEKNETISSFVEDGKTFEVLFINTRAGMAVVKVSPEIKDYIIKKRYLNIDMRSHKVEAHYHVIQCFKCQKFGHTSESEKCSLKDDECVCLYCNENHKSSDCPNKKQKSQHRCSNCIEKGNKSYNHTSNSNVCPLYQRALQAVIDNTLSSDKTQGN